MKHWACNLYGQHQRGITLVELMIAMLLGLFLTAGILQLFASNKQTYRVTENMSRLQENGRFAMHFLTQDIRMADFWGCRGPGIAVDSNLGPITAYDSYTTPLTGINDDASAGGTDSIVIRGVTGTGISVIETLASTGANLIVSDNSGLEMGDIVIVSDCADGDIFEITNDPSSGVVIGQDALEHTTAGNADGSFRKQYGTDAQVYKLNFATYSIQDGVNGRPALFREVNDANAQELVEDIEDMQILYGEDTDADGAPNYYKPVDDVSLNINNVVAVRISLVSATADDNVTDQANTYTLFDSANITPTDRRIRRVFTSTVVMRNRLP